MAYQSLFKFNNRSSFLVRTYGKIKRLPLSIFNSNYPSYLYNISFPILIPVTFASDKISRKIISSFTKIISNVSYRYSNIQTTCSSISLRYAFEAFITKLVAKLYSYFLYATNKIECTYLINSRNYDQVVEWKLFYFSHKRKSLIKTNKNNSQALY